jgi:hypothetical protein
MSEQSFAQSIASWDKQMLPQQHDCLVTPGYCWKYPKTGLAGEVRTSLENLLFVTSKQVYRLRNRLRALMDKY